MFLRLAVGGGPNLYLFEKEGIQIGGLDYSNRLIGIAARVLREPRELICEEAVNLRCELKYDAVFSEGVFHYFESYEYAEKVMRAMYNKANQVIGVFDVLDKEKEEEFTQFRKELCEDYEEKYRELPKLFYKKSFFQEFAQKHDMSIEFMENYMNQYWNNNFTFGCVMRKNKKIKKRYKVF